MTRLRTRCTSSTVRGGSGSAGMASGGSVPAMSANDGARAGPVGVWIDSASEYASPGPMAGRFCGSMLMPCMGQHMRVPSARTAQL